MKNLLLFIFLYRSDLNTHMDAYLSGKAVMMSGYAVGKHCLAHSPGLVQTSSFIKWSTVYK